MQTARRRSFAYGLNISGVMWLMHPFSAAGICRWTLMETPASQLSVAPDKRLTRGWLSPRGLVFQMLWCDLDWIVPNLN